MTHPVLSPRGLQMIAGFEGYVGHPYDDATGNATIGYGHLIHLGPVTASDRERYANFTEAQARAMLANDCGAATAAVQRLVTRPLGSGQADALISFTFNCGEAALRQSTLLKLVNESLGPAGAVQITTAFQRWCHDSHGHVIAGLLTRRTDEAHLFLQGVYP